MNFLYDAGSISENLFEDKSRITFPPLPLTFEGKIDLETFSLYEKIFMDDMSLAYLLEEQLIGEKSKAFIRELHEDKIILKCCLRILLMGLNSVIHRGLRVTYGLKSLS